MKKIRIWLLCGILLLTGCGSDNGEVAESGTAATRAVLEATLEALDAEVDSVQAPVATETPETISRTEVPSSTPEEALNHYITACLSGDTTSATEVIAMGVRSLCEPKGALSSAKVGEFEISGKTARVQWSWTLPEGAGMTHLFTLGQLPQGWRITGMDKVSETWLEKEAVEVEIELQEEFDDELSDQIVYLVQEGVEGEKNVTTKHTTTWVDGTGTTESEVVSEEILTEAEPMIVVFGKKSETETASELTSLVEQYFTSYQAGEYDNLLALAPKSESFDYAKASEVAGFEITSFEISEPSEMVAIKPTEGEDFEWAERKSYYYIEGDPIIEPFVMQVEVPVNIKYKLFGMEFDSTRFEKIMLRSSLDARVWTMPFWGVTGASQVGEQVTLKDLTITLDGVVTTHNATIVALTADQSAQMTAAAIGERSEYASCKSGRCSVRFSELEAPDTFTLLLSSGIIGFGSESHEFEIQLTR